VRKLHSTAHSTDGVKVVTVSNAQACKLPSVEDLKPWDLEPDRIAVPCHPDKRARPRVRGFYDAGFV